MATELPRPGVEVMQVIRTVSPTVVTPTLVPCVVGVCKQIVDVLVPASGGGNKLNTSALISLPAILHASDAAGSPAAYGGLDGLDLVLSVNNGPDVTVTFDGASLTPTSVVAQILAAFQAVDLTDVTAEVLGDGFRIKTLGVGEFQSLEVKSTSDAAVLSAFGFIAGYVLTGATAYDQDYLQVPQASFPDPRGNLAELGIEADTIRIFLGMGSGSDLRELSRTTSHLRRGAGGTAGSVTGTVSLATAYSSLATQTLKVSIDGGTEQTVTFASPGSETEAIQQVNAALGGVYASENTGLVLTSKTKGATSSIKVTGGTAAATLGFVVGVTGTGTAGVRVVDDGNGDGVSPLVECTGADFTAVGTAAVATGLADLSLATYPGDFDGKTLTLSVTGREPQTLTFASTADQAAVLAQINAFWTGLLTATVNGSNQLVLTTAQHGEEGTIEVIGGDALAALGLVPSVTGQFSFSNVSPDFTALNGKKLRLDLNGVSVEHSFSGFTNLSTGANVATALNATISSYAVAEFASAALRIRLKAGGKDAYVRVAAASSNEAAAIMGFDIDQKGTFARFEGHGFPPVSGDDLYVDGSLVGRITQVAPGGNAARVRLDKQLPIDAKYGEHFHIVAKNLSTTSTTRPTPELVVALDGTPALKHDVLRSTVGEVITAKCPVYISYRAVRKDVTAVAKKPGLLRIDDTSELDALIEPVNVLNPLALGFYFALLNAPGAQVSGLGVDAVSADAPYGTVEAFTRAAEFLEAYEVYAIAPLTHDETVAQVFNTHVSAMSAPAAKGERICLFNFTKPSKKVDTLVASGLTGNSVGSGGTQFDTGVANLPGLVLSQGINPVGTVAATKGLFLDVASSSKKYSIASISGGVVTIRTSFSAGENDDGFYATTDLNDAPMPATLIDEPFAVRVRGDALTRPDGTPDKQGIAETYQALGQSYLNRRFWSIVPDAAAATLNGLEQTVEGFYMCAAIAGMIGQQPPQQSFTNFPMTGFTKVLGSNDFFTEKQLNVIAAGGNYIVVQDKDGAPLTARMALTTDMTSIETRTDSIQKVVDFTAKFMRSGLKNFIGRFNITQGFLDSLGHIVQGLLGFLTDIGVLIGANMNNIVQDETAPDTVLIDVTLDVPYPCNYIRLTLVI